MRRPVIAIWIEHRNPWWCPGWLLAWAWKQANEYVHYCNEHVHYCTEVDDG